jgi:hypothetical protein
MGPTAAGAVVGLLILAMYLGVVLIIWFRATNRPAEVEVEFRTRNSSLSARVKPLDDIISKEAPPVLDIPRTEERLPTRRSCRRPYGRPRQ